MAALEAANDLTVKNNLRLVVYPLIDEMDAPLYRCVIAATIGCDTLPSGISGLGAKRLHALIDEKKLIDYNSLIGMIVIAPANKDCETEAELCVVIDALMCMSCATRLSCQQEKRQLKAKTIRTQFSNTCFHSLIIR